MGRAAGKPFVIPLEVVDHAKVFDTDVIIFSSVADIVVIRLDSQAGASTTCGGFSDGLKDGQIVVLTIVIGTGGVTVANGVQATTGRTHNNDANVNKTLSPGGDALTYQWCAGNQTWTQIGPLTNS